MSSVKVKILKPCKWNDQEFTKKEHVGRTHILSASCADDLCRAGKAVMVHDLDAMRKKVEGPAAEEKPAEPEAKPKKKSSRKSRKSSKKKSSKKKSSKKKPARK